ncbi:MAG: MATE family efflux transporter [Treponema sp.]|jgi:putative MATE family efflux protein|nr:MATE family efflux transporter [Treponema sp.]
MAFPQHFVFRLPGRRAAGSEDDAPGPGRWTNRRLWRLIWPLVIEQTLALAMGVADTVMVSSVGEHAVSGVNVVDNITNLLIIAFSAMATGGAVVTSQYIGRQDRQNARLASKQLVYVIILISTLTMAFTLPLRNLIIRVIYGDIGPQVLEQASLYFLITAFSYPFLGLYNGCAALFRAAGNSRVPMLIALLVNAINIGGNMLFIFGLRIGVAGAALSTLLSRTTAALVLAGMLAANRGSPISLAGLFKVRLVRPMIRNILNVGIPSGLENSMFQVGRLMTQRIFPYFGTAAMAGNAIASVVNSCSFMPGNAFGMALLTVVGQCIGAGDYAEAKRQTAKIMKAAWMTIFILSVVIYLAMDPIISIFNVSDEARLFARSYLRLHCISMALFWAFSFCLPNALRAAGDARYVMIAASVSMWTVRVSCSYLLSFAAALGPVGVWAGMGIDFISRGACYMGRWLGGRWQTKRVIRD